MIIAVSGLFGTSLAALHDQRGQIEDLRTRVDVSEIESKQQDTQIRSLLLLNEQFVQDAATATARVNQSKADQDALRDRNKRLLDEVARLRSETSRLRSEAERLRRDIDGRASRARRATPASPGGGVRVASGVPVTLRRIAGCESGSGPTSAPDYRAQNPVSTASGAYQFVNGTWRAVTGLAPPAKAHPPEVQDAAAIKLWDGGRGASHWAASRHCWG